MTKNVGVSQAKATVISEANHEQREQNVGTTQLPHSTGSTKKN